MPATVDLGVSGIEVHTGDHICAFYRGAERDQVLIPYLQSGLRSGDKCICVVDAVEPQLLLASLDDPSVDERLERHQLEVLASAGVVGLVGFLVMWLAVFIVLWRVDPRFGTLAVAVLMSRFVQAQFDLFWAAVQGSVPFVVLGICLGAKWYADRQAEPPVDRARRPAEPAPAATT